MVQYPEGVLLEEGDKWLMGEVLAYLREQPEINRMLSSRIIQSVNDFPFHRVVELWLEGPEEWQEVIARTSVSVSKPEWAQTDTFPYLRPSFNIASIFLTDIPASDNYTQYRGYITMR